MDKRPVKLLIFLLFVFFPLSATAAGEGLYLSAGFGGNYVQETENDNSSGSFNIALDYGYAASLALGYDLGNEHPDLGRGRVDIEFGYRSNELDEVEFLEGKSPGDGDLNVMSVMLTTYGEPEDRSEAWTPYICLGIGAAEITLDNATVADSPLVDDSDWVLAGQVGLGSGYAISDHLTLDLGYRFFVTSPPEFKDAEGQNFDSEYYSHLLQAGIRMSF